VKAIPVFYSHQMVADTQSYSPSAGKPKAVVADWMFNELPVEIVPANAVTPDQIKYAHDSRHVDFILACEKPNGFGNKDASVAASLPYTIGAMRDASEHALRHGVACAPVSGFHHAGYDFAGGFCTFNGLMVAAIDLKRKGLANRIAILDLDMHYGNGTQDILDILDPNMLEHFSQSFQAEEAEEFLYNLPIYIQKWTERNEPLDLLMYQAGADSHVDDPLGGYLTTEQMRRRDRIVFETCKKLDVPVVWNLAGGYQRDGIGSIAPVLALHRATMEECMAVYL
jgi:acetoin utilization deacetylase AcuC-like enzyme